MKLTQSVKESTTPIHNRASNFFFPISVNTRTDQLDNIFQGTSYIYW